LGPESPHSPLSGLLLFPLPAYSGSNLASVFLVQGSPHSVKDESERSLLGRSQFRTPLFSEVRAWSPHRRCKFTPLLPLVRTSPLKRPLGLHLRFRSVASPPHFSFTYGPNPFPPMLERAAISGMPVPNWFPLSRF